MDGVQLKEIRVLQGRVEYDFVSSGKLKPYFTTETLFIDYQENMELLPQSILVIPFIASLLPLMWVTDTSMLIPEVDNTFYDAILRIKDAYQKLYSHFPLKGKLVAESLVENTFSPQKEAMLLFGGGVDANCTYLRIRDKKPTLFNIQGWFENRDDVNLPADADITDIGNFAQSQGLDFSYAKSNFALVVNEKLWGREILPRFHDTWWHGFQHSMAFISIAIPYAYKNGMSNIYIASSVPRGQSCMCASQVTTDSEFRFAGTGRCIHDGAELVRQDKVKIIADYQRQTGKAYPIRVCSFNDHNCCECEKCFRTVLGFVAEAADVRNFGFYIEKTLKDHWEEVMKRRSGLMSFKSEKVLHWPYIIERMKENYHLMSREQKDFVDWFLSFDFEKAQRFSLLRYYKTNFWSILKRKISNR